jgi:hypothetical protein
VFELIYVDQDETRSWEILEHIDRREAVERFPDFDIAYLRAAYITPSIDDHGMAEIAILEEGLERSVRKSEILARVSCWHCWNCVENDIAFGSSAAAVKAGVHALLAGGVPKGPGSRLQVWALVTELVRHLDRRLSDDLYWKGPRAKLGPRQEREVRVTAETCLRSFPMLATAARQAIVEHIVPKLGG